MSAGQFGRYIVRDKIGQGGMATVYRAYDPHFQRDVALKVLPHHFLSDATFRSRFEKEAQLIASLEHHAIVPVYDFGEDNGRPYLVMRLMTGGSLEDWLARGPLPAETVNYILQRIASALDKAHEHHIVHRDLKPGNILFDDDRMPYLADFGIARITEGTQTTTIIGTAQYMAPEQAQGKPLDRRTDVYQLGVVTYEMLAGHVPYRGDNSSAILYQHVHETLPKLRSLNPKVTPACEAAVSRALAKKPEERYTTAGSFAAAFGRALKGIAPPAPSSLPRWAWAVAAVVLLALILVGARAIAGPGPVPTPTVVAEVTGAVTEELVTEDSAEGGTTATATIVATSTSAPGDTPTPPPTPTDTPTPVILSYPLQSTLGFSGEDTPIQLYQFGNGANAVLLVGGFHSGYSPGSVTIAQRAIEHLEDNPGIMPGSVSVYIIPNLNPDTLYAPGSWTARLNSNGVDLNRNWDCNWRPNAEFGSRAVGGGATPFSEPEAQILKDLIEDIRPQAVIVWGARAARGLAVPGGCGDQTLVSAPLAAVFGFAAGYEVDEWESDYELTGDVTNWLDKIGIPAIYVLTPDYVDPDWSDNRAGIEAVIASLQ